MKDLMTRYRYLLNKKATTNSLFFSQDEEIYNLRRLLSGIQLVIPFTY